MSEALDMQVMIDAVTGKVLERLDSKFVLVYEKMDAVASAAAGSVKEAANIAAITVKEAASLAASTVKEAATIAAMAVREAASIAEKRATEVSRLEVLQHKSDCPLNAIVGEMRRDDAAKGGHDAGEKETKKRLSATAWSIIGFCGSGGLFMLFQTIKTIASMVPAVVK